VFVASIVRSVMPSPVTAKGQVTIPKEVRDRLGIGPGSVVAFEIGDDGRVVLTNAIHPAARRPPAIDFGKLRGTSTAGLSTEEIMRLTRGE
jgi:antitoxin PrlF